MPLVMDRERMLEEIRKQREMTMDPALSMSRMVSSGDDIGPAEIHDDEDTGWLLPILGTLATGGAGAAAGWALRSPKYIRFLQGLGAYGGRASRYKDSATKLWEGAQATRWGRVTAQRAAAATPTARRAYEFEKGWRGTPVEELLLRRVMQSKMENAKKMEKAMKELAKALAGKG